MTDVWNTLATTFGGFDGFTWAIMAIVMVGAAFMMPTMSAIVTATCGALFVFGFAIFLRSVIAAKDAQIIARDDWQYALGLELRTVLVYAAVFCFAISIIYAVRMVSKQQ